MIRHIVMWTLHDAADIPFFKAQLESCRDLVPGLLSLEIGVASDGLESNCHVVLNSCFADKAALDAYQNHPHHRAVGASVSKLRSQRQVLDYTV
jgi:quinol monooxygenase YgiN